jgi:hypothetical protein
MAEEKEKKRRRKEEEKKKEKEERRRDSKYSGTEMENKKKRREGEKKKRREEGKKEERRKRESLRVSWLGRSEGKLEKNVFISYHKSRVGSGTRDFQKNNPQPDPAPRGYVKKNPNPRLNPKNPNFSGRCGAGRAGRGGFCSPLVARFQPGI